MLYIPEGILKSTEGLVEIAGSGEGRFQAGRDGVRAILSTGDRKVDFIVYAGHVLAWVHSEMGHPACYPLLPARIERPVRAVLMDLDGTSIRSESFWIWIIQETVATLMGRPDFRLAHEDEPFVSGHSVSEHLSYCLAKYCPGRKVEEARAIYFETTRREMRAILEGRGRPGAFSPTPGLKEFLLALKARDIRIGLVTSGLYEKAWPEVLSGFEALGLGDPKAFYDCIITAGFPLTKGEVGTLGELSPKPHPWLYAETARVGLGLAAKDRHRVVGIEDSGAGVVSIRLAGFAAIGIAGGNIATSGTQALLEGLEPDFPAILRRLDG